MDKSSAGESNRKKSKKLGSFADALADLDKFQTVPKKKATTVKVYDQKKNCDTGLYEVKKRKVYARKKEKPTETNQHPCEPTISSATRINEDHDDSMDASNDNLESEENYITAEFLETLDEIEEQFQNQKQPKEWTRRKQNLEDNWARSRCSLFRYLLLKECIPEANIGCTKCKMNVAVLRCASCRDLLCSDCDTEVHSINHFHDREMWLNGFYEGICNNVTVIDGALVHVERPLPVSWPSKCQACQDDNTISRICVDSKITIITTNGRFQFNDVLFRCTSCFSQFVGCTQMSMIVAGFWPSSPQKSATFYAMELLQLWEELSNNSPGTSLSSFIKSLERISKRAGRPNSITATSFGKSFREWLAVKESLRFQKGEDRFKCPVCENNCHSIHIDGHRKTYRFKKVPRGGEDSLYGAKFIANDEEVQSHMKVLYDKMGSQDYKEDKLCGASYWQAARSKSKTNFGTLDETGLVVAGCRHVLALKAVNMFAGEQYGYALFLHKLLAGSLKMSFIWQDIMCKYWPWLERVVGKLPEFSHLLNSSKALSVMHAKAHSLDCQLVWGGSYQDNAALSTGESMEQFFSYFAKCGLTTKNMNASARRDTLTEHTAFWNERKVETLAASLAKQYVKTKDKISNVTSEKSSLLISAAVKIDDLLIEEWEADFRAKAAASLQRQSSATVVNQLAEYYRLHQEIYSVPMLENYVKNTDKASSIITGQEELYEVFNSTRESILRKRKRMEQLEEKLVTREYKQEDVLRDGKEFLTKHTLDLLRTRLLHTYLNQQQQKLEISRLADTSKKRIKIRKAMTKTSAILEKTVTKYNTVKNLSITDVAELDKSDVASGKFAWQVDEVQCRVPIWLRKQIVDKHVTLKRCKEELDLLLKEMAAYVRFYYSQIRSNKAEITKIQKSIVGLKSGVPEDAVLKELDLTVVEHQIKEDLFNHFADGNTEMTLRGLICLRQEGISLFKERLRLGAYWFKRVIGQQFDVPNNQDEDESDGPDEEAFDMEEEAGGSEEEDDVDAESNSVSILDSVVDSLSV